MADNEAGFGAGVAFIDGAYCAAAEARISIFDLGFLLSDATYDVAKVWKGAFFRLDDHLDRFERSLATLRLSLPYDRAAITGIVMECVRRSGLRDALVEVIATRGITTDGRRDLRRCRNNFIAFAVPLISILTAEEMAAGAHLAVSTVPRIPADSVDPRIKNFNRLDFSQALFEAYDRGAEYAVLPDHEGNLTEGLGYNVFALYGGRLLTPEAGVLEGVTRGTVMAMCAELNVEAAYAKMPATTLKDADEVFLATTAGGILPISRVDGQAVGDGAPGPVTQRLSDMYWAWHEKPEYRTPVDYGPVAA